MSLTHLSLFSGIGGLDIAAEMAGFETVGQCEWADYPTKVLEKHWPGLPRWRDIRTLTGESFYERTGLRTVDIISGGFPCQPFSLAGQRRGQADDRYLWPEMLRVVSELRPTWVVGENVAGLVSMVKSRKALGVEGRIVSILQDEIHYEATWIQQEDMLLMELIEDLERLGYSVQAFVIPACAVGAAHRRDRIALVAHASGTDAGGRRKQLKGEEPTNRKQTQLLFNSGGGGGTPKAWNYNKDVADTNNTAPARQRKDGREIHTEPKSERPCVGSIDAPSGKESTANHPLENADHGGCGKQKYVREQPRGAKSCGASETVPDAEIPERKGERRETRGRRAEPGRGSGGTAQPGLGGVVDGIPAWMDRYWLEEPDIPRVASEVGRVDKLKALGNAVYWRQYYPIFAGIYDIEIGGFT